MDAGNFAGAVGVLQENLPGILESCHFDVADGEAEKRADFGFVQQWMAEAFVLLNDAAFGVEHERSGKRGDAAVLETNVVAGNGDGIVDAEFFSKFLDGILIVVIDDEAENLEAIFVFVLQLDKVGNFGAARSAPGSPEIQEDDFAFGAGERDGLAIEAGEFEVRCGIGVADEADAGLLFLGNREGGKEAKKQRSNDKKNQAGVESVSHGVIYRRAQCGIDAKPDVETGRSKEQAERKEKGVRLEAGRAPVAKAFISLGVLCIVAPDR